MHNSSIYMVIVVCLCFTTSSSSKSLSVLKVQSSKQPDMDTLGAEIINLKRKLSTKGTHKIGRMDAYTKNTNCIIKFQSDIQFIFPGKSSISKTNFLIPKEIETNSLCKTNTKIFRISWTISSSKTNEVIESYLQFHFFTEGRTQVLKLITIMRSAEPYYYVFRDLKSIFNSNTNPNSFKDCNISSSNGKWDGLDSISKIKIELRNLNFQIVDENFNNEERFNSKPKICQNQNDDINTKLSTSLKLEDGGTPLYIFLRNLGLLLAGCGIVIGCVMVVIKIWSKKSTVILKL